MVLIEAMAMRRAIMVAAGTSAEELSQDGAALAVPPSGQAVTQAASRLLRDEDARQQMGLRAAAAARERFAPPQVAAAYEQVYDELLDG
jgi:glycosyltransferase involved in cell wall biosynthesis